jgi:acyl-CoA reductase-like NAD-dependent aldehyde dehydrogenase
MKIIVNCETGEIFERELNKAEKDQQKIDQAAEAARHAEAQTKAEQRQAIADRLGLTLDELKLLLG